MPTKGAKPNSRYDLYENGKLRQSRWFDNKGNVVRNRDYFHQDPLNNHTFPHDHEWDWTKDIPRLPENLQADYDKYY